MNQTLEGHNGQIQVSSFDPFYVLPSHRSKFVQGVSTEIFKAIKHHKAMYVQVHIITLHSIKKRTYIYTKITNAFYNCFFFPTYFDLKIVYLLMKHFYVHGPQNFLFDRDMQIIIADRAEQRLWDNLLN